MISITAVHIFKAQSPSVLDLLESVVDILDYTTDSVDLFLKEIELAEDDDVCRNYKFIRKNEGGYSVSFNAIVATVENTDIRIYVAAPEATEGWKETSNLSFLSKKLVLFHDLADKGLADLVFAGKTIYGREDYVYLFCKKPYFFYSDKPLSGIFREVSTDANIDRLRKKECVQVKNTLISKRRFLKSITGNKPRTPRAPG